MQQENKFETNEKSQKLGTFINQLYNSHAWRYFASESFAEAFHAT